MFLKKHVFAFIAFLVPLLLRAIPEILMNPYIVGFDVMGHYVPTSIIWLNSGVNLNSFVATAPLFYAIVVAGVLSGEPLMVVLKIIPPLFHGLLGLSIYGYARIGLQWSPKKSVVPALIGTVYFVALRISWDLLREQLALIFLFGLLTLLALWRSNKFSWRRYGLISLVTVAIVLTNQLIAVLMFGIIMFSILYFAFYRRRKVIGLFAFSLPAVVLFFAIWYLSPSVSEYRLIFGFSNLNDGWLALFGYSSYPAMLASEAGFFLYCFLLLLPLALLSIRRFNGFEIRSWLVLIAVAVLVPMVSPSNLRWIMMLVYPLGFYIAETLSRLKSVTWGRFRKTGLYVGVVYLVVVTSVLSFGLLLMPPEKPFLYFDSSKVNSFVYQVPTSLLQNSVSIADCPDVANSLAWFKDNLNSSAVLLTHRAFYGWAISTINANQVVLYEYDNPADAAAIAVNQGHTQVYLVWWVKGQGWYGLPTVPAAFQEVYHSGKIAIYSYVP